MKSEVINFRLNPKRADDKRILDFLEAQMRVAEQENAFSEKKTTQTEVIKRIFLEAIEKSKQQREEQIKKEETAALVAEITDSLHKEMSELIQEHDMKMMALLLSVVSGTGNTFVSSVNVPTEKSVDMLKELKESKTADELQELDSIPVTEEAMDEDMKAGLMSMFD